jgi:hypothetical protein
MGGVSVFLIFAIDVVIGLICLVLGPALWEFSRRRRAYERASDDQYSPRAWRV